MPQCEKKILVYRITLAMDTLLFRHSRLKAGPLFGNIYQFTETIGEFHPAGVELKALGDLFAAGFRTRQRRQR